MADAYLSAFTADRDHIAAVLAALETHDYSLLRDAVCAYVPVRLNPLRGEAKCEAQ